MVFLEHAQDLEQGPWTQNKSELNLPLSKARGSHRYGCEVHNVAASTA